MTRSSLNSGQSRLVQIIEELGFGRIEQLTIRHGEPYYERTPRIIQEIKLGSEGERRPEHSETDVTLKKAFENLFNQLACLRDGVVEVEVRHSLPFRLILERCYKEPVP